MNRYLSIIRFYVTRKILYNKKQDGEEYEQ